MGVTAVLDVSPVLGITAVSDVTTPFVLTE